MYDHLRVQKKKRKNLFSNTFLCHLALLFAEESVRVKGLCRGEKVWQIKKTKLGSGVSRWQWNDRNFRYNYERKWNEYQYRKNQISSFFFFFCLFFLNLLISQRGWAERERRTRAAERDWHRHERSEDPMAEAKRHWQESWGIYYLIWDNFLLSPSDTPSLHMSVTVFLLVWASECSSSLCAISHYECFLCFTVFFLQYRLSLCRLLHLSSLIGVPLQTVIEERHRLHKERKERRVVIP